LSFSNFGRNFVEKEKVLLTVKALVFGKDDNETNSFMQRFVPFNHYYFMNTYLRKIAITQTENTDSDEVPELEWIDLPEKNELQHYSEWLFEYLPIPFYIQLRDTNLVLDVYYKKKEPGTPVVMFRLKHHHPWYVNHSDINRSESYMLLGTPISCGGSERMVSSKVYSRD